MRQRKKAPITFYVVREFDTKRVICCGDSIFCADALGLAETSFVRGARTGDVHSYLKAIIVERYPGRMYVVTKAGKPVGKFGTLREAGEAMHVTQGGAQYALAEATTTSGGYRVKMAELPYWRAEDSVERYAEAKYRRRSIGQTGKHGRKGAKRC